MVLMTVFLNQWWRVAQEEARENSGRLPRETAIVGDEWGNLPAVLALPEIATLGRSYRLHAYCFTQDLKQWNKYSRSGDQNAGRDKILGSMGGKVVLSLASPENFQYFTRLTGKRTVRTRSQGTSKQGFGFGSRAGSSDSYSERADDLIHEWEWQNRVPVRDGLICIKGGENSRPGREGAAVTYMYHHVIGFNPDERSCNGGSMTLEKCMQFAREWVQGRYPNQEAVWVLHKEHCAADSTDRYAVRVGINRTDLETGNRLHEGLGRAAKVARANAMREMDARWGLRQLEKGQRNSRVHAMQPTKAEKEMRARGAAPDKGIMRECVTRRVREIAQEAPEGNRMRELRSRRTARSPEPSRRSTKRERGKRRAGFAA